MTNGSGHDREHAAADVSGETPHESIWPAAFGLGLTLALFGIVTSLVLSALGVLLMGWALRHWIGEILHE